MDWGLLVYDADCAFCSRFATWSGSAVPWQELDLEQVGATVDQVTAAAGWLSGGRIVGWGAEAIALAMIQRGGVAGLAGRSLRLPVIRVAAELVYAVVARNRHLMPGGTASCSTVPRGEPRHLMLVAMALILSAGLASFAASNHQKEPYPSLMMPGFRNVPEVRGTVFSSEVTYTLVESDGTTRDVSPERLLGPHAGYVAAIRTLTAPAAASDPSVGRWLRANLGRAARGVTAVRVDWRRVGYDTHTRQRRSDAVLKSVTINLAPER